MLGVKRFVHCDRGIYVRSKTVLYIVTEGCMLGVRGFVRCDRGVLGVKGFVRCDRGML